MNLKANLSLMLPMQPKLGEEHSGELRDCVYVFFQDYHAMGYGNLELSKYSLHR